MRDHLEQIYTLKAEEREEGPVVDKISGRAQSSPDIETSFSSLRNEVEVRTASLFDDPGEEEES